MEEEAAGLLNQIWKDIITFSVFLVKKRRTTKNRCRELAEISENLLANYCPCIPPRGNHISHLNFYFQIERKYRGGWKTIRSEKAIVSLLMLGVIINDLAFGKNEGCMLLQLILREKVSFAVNEAVGVGRWMALSDDNATYFYRDLFDNKVLKKFAQILTSVPKSVISEVENAANRTFPWHKLRWSQRKLDRVKEHLVASGLDYEPCDAGQYMVLAIGVGNVTSRRTRILLPSSEQFMRTLWLLSCGMCVGGAWFYPDLPNAPCEDEDCQEKHLWHTVLLGLDGMLSIFV